MKTKAKTKNERNENLVDEFFRIIVILYRERGEERRGMTNDHCLHSLTVRKNFIGFRDRFEFFFGLCFVMEIFIRMPLKQSEKKKKRMIDLILEFESLTFNANRR
jgi:hypothetical protein